MLIQVGSKAPEFKLYSSDRSEVSLSDYKGQNVVLLFFPLAFTSTCTTEMCSMRDDIGNYDDMKAQVLAISVDTPMTLAKWKEELELNFPLLSDFNKDVARSYNVLYDEFVLGMRGVAKRSAFVIDKNGTVKYAEVLESARDLPNFDAITKTLSRLN